jgi:hemoglobin
MPGMYSMLGGRPAFEAAVEDFYHRIVADPHLRAYFEHIDLGRLKGHQHSFLAIALGGPRAYIGRTMSSAHATLAVTDEAFDRVLEHLVHTLADAGVPAGGIRDVVTGLLGLRHDIVRVPGLERDRERAAEPPLEAPAGEAAEPAAAPDPEVHDDVEPWPEEPWPGERRPAARRRSSPDRTRLVAPKPGSAFEPHPENPANSGLSRRPPVWR